MAELKTKKNDKSVVDFLNKVENEKRRQDSFKLLKIMKKITGDEPFMWGDSIIGFGDYHYKYTSGRDASWFQVGFSPRKQNLSLYIMSGFTKYDALLKKLGKHKKGKSCLYISKLEDVKIEVLEELIVQSIKALKSV